MYEQEAKKKSDLDSEFKNLKQELEDIDVAFPKEIMDYKAQIVQSKKTTEEFEEKTRILADELRELKAQLETA